MNILREGEKFRHIYHIADIHIRNTQRHEEYFAVFKQLYSKLEKMVEAKKPGVIVLAGDIVHSKTELSPESVDIVSNFLKRLATIMPVVMIPGNHDGVINNRDRMDALSPIVDNLNDPNVYYFKNGGIVYFGNLVFGISSVFEGNTIQDPDKIKGSKFCKVYLYHGGVDSCKLSNNSNMICQTVVDDFNGWDLVLLGDVHRHQFLKPNMAYSGSLIQQSRGEDLRQHGMIQWDVQTKKGKFIPIHNNYGYVDIYLTDGQISDADGNPIDIKTQDIPKKPRIRFIARNTTNFEIAKITDKLKGDYQIQDTIVEYDDSGQVVGQSVPQVQRIDRDSNMQLETMVQIINDIFDKDQVPENERSDVMGMFMDDYRHKINTDERTICNWKIKTLKFSNMFIYGENNKIDFSNFKNCVVGIVGDNHIGKSAIIDILMYCIYGYNNRVNVTGRQNMINNKKDHCRVELTFVANDIDYTITRSLRAGNKGATGDVTFTATKDGVTENLAGKSQKDTDKKIVELLGEYDDYVATFVNLQNDVIGFIEKTQSKRKDFLIKMFRLDMFEAAMEQIKKKKKETNQDLTNAKRQLGDVELSVLQMEIGEAEGKVTSLQDKLITIKKSIKEYNACIENCSTEIEKLDIDFDPQKTETLKTQRTKLEKMIASHEEKIEEYTSKLAENKLPKITEKRIERVDTKRRNFEKRRDKFIKEQEKEIECLLCKKTEVDDSDLASLPDLTADLEKYTADVERLEAQLASYQEKVEKLGDDETEYNENDYANWKKELTKLLALKNKLGDANAKLEGIDEALKIMGNPTFNIKCGVCKKNNEAWVLQHEKQNANRETTLKLKEKLESDIAKLVTEKTLNKNIANYESACKIREQREQYAERIESLTNTLKEKRSMIKGLNKDIVRRKRMDKKLLADKQVDGEICKIRKLIDDQRAEICEAVEKLEADQKRRQEILEQRTKWKLQRSELEGKCKDCKHTLKDINKQFEKMDMYSEALAKNTELKDTIKDSTQERERLEQEKDHVMKQLAELNSELKIKRDKQNKYKDAGGILDKLEYNLRVLKRYEALMNRDGIPRVFLNKIIPRIERNVNNIISQVADFTLDLVLTEKEELQLYIKYGKRKQLADLGCGLEKFLINLALRIVLSEFANVSKPNFLAIDEGFVGFDSNHMNNLNRVFDYLKGKFDFIVIITHLQSLKSNIDVELAIRNEGGYSYITSG